MIKWRQKMKEKYFIIGGAILMITVFAILSVINTNRAEAFALEMSTKTTSTAGNAATSSESIGYQEATLSMNNWEYVVTPSTLKKGIPVRMIVDTSKVVGCAADVTIREFGVRKYVNGNDNIISFTPTKTGKILIACSMNMYFGSFNVIDEANPDALAEVQATIPKSTGKTCGASGGGCGCGARNI
jgi:plastocyanin domain-containing protein